jgi:hypothetical protein
MFFWRFSSSGKKIEKYVIVNKDGRGVGKRGGKKKEKDEVEKR